MCSAAVRTTARTLASDGSWPAGLPFYETVNEAPAIASLPSAWFTLGFIAESDDPVSVGASPTFREVGRVVVSVMGRAGTGDSTLITLADQVAPVVRTVFPAAGISVRGVSPPTLIDDGIDGEFERYDVQVDFQRFH